MYYSNNPVWDAERYYQNCEKRKAQLPKCSECGEPITAECAYEVNGEIICEDCMTDNHRVWIDDLVVE